MQEVGYVETSTRSGYIVIRSRRVLRVGTSISDANGRALGRVMRVFGPVKSPYMTVKAAADVDIMELLKQKVYIMGDKNDKKERGSHHKGRSNKMPGMRKHPHNKRLSERRAHM